MWLFKRRKKTGVGLGDSSMGTKLGNGFIKLQTVFADRLNSAAANISTRRLKIGLITFCSIGCGLSIYVAVSALAGDDVNSNVIQIDQASIPKHFNKSGDVIKGLKDLVDEELYHQVKAFRLYADSLQNFNKAAYDSLLITRPGLIDSVNAIEEIYLSQTIK